MPDDPYYHGRQAGPHFAPNLWPRQPLELEAIWTTYYHALEPLGTLIMRIFTRALELPEQFFDDKIDKHTACLRVLNYPHQVEQPAPGQLRAGAHSDYGTLTIVRHEDHPPSGGRQVQNRAGRWVDVPEVSDSFIVNIGDMMMPWTNDRWISTMHRVVNPLPRMRATAGASRSSSFISPTTMPSSSVCRAASVARTRPSTPGHIRGLAAHEVHEDHHLHHELRRRRLSRPSNDATFTER